ncbi:ABC transporter substrate-binding protein [Salipiger sp. PrR002]|uniref:ABC transporter substrate-binding protein n=1 Tax=Salipiger sp. PrR002 TaxID=2706489 RepID=UPI0013BB7686|nr:ABC transporter substrate-binding protein [Salipiger sp. PrR002]NDW00848.1 peptide ABC transporter substrate-binding protein [Salipiger sp. PrR002]NDW58031.1 peptide ABC transporter substrate-binding protein [Salipiger sp. PrR004]
MTYRTGRLVAALLASTIAGQAFAQDVTVVLSEELNTVEPCMATQSNVGRVLLQNVSETLTELVPGEGLQPRLATEWEDMGNGTWRFKLRDGVSFSDGTSFDAEDVKFSLERNLSDKFVCETGAKYYGGMALSTNIVDEHTIEITSDPAQPILPLLMSTLAVLPSETNPDAFTDTPVGTGPYTFDEYARGQHIKLSARDDYWGDAPEVKSATYLFRSESAVRAAMVAAGEADIAPNIALQDATDKSTDYAYPNSETVYMRLDLSAAPLDDVRVRQALNYAVDKEAFVGTILADGTLLATGMTPPSTIGYNHDLTPYPFDPDKAKGLLEAAQSDGVDVGAEITVIGRLENFANVVETMEALTSMWQDVGLNVKLQMVEVAEWNKYYSKPFPEDLGPTMVEAMHDNANGDPVFSMFNKYASDGVQSGTADPKLDEMITKATTAAGDEREALWEEVFAYIHDDLVADVFLWHMVGMSRVNERLDFTPSIRTNSELQLSQISFK